MTWGESQPEAYAAVVRRVVAPVGGPAILGRIEGTAAPKDLVGAKLARRTHGVNLQAVGVIFFIIAILHPLTNITVNVIEAPGVGLFLAYRMCRIPGIVPIPLLSKINI